MLAINSFSSLFDLRNIREIFSLFHSFATPFSARKNLVDVCLTSGSIFCDSFTGLRKSINDLFFLSPTFTSNSLPRSTGMVANMVAAKEATIISFCMFPSLSNKFARSPKFILPVLVWAAKDTGLIFSMLEFWGMRAVSRLVV